MQDQWRTCTWNRLPPSMHQSKAYGRRQNGRRVSVLGSVCWLDTLMSKKRKPQLSRCLRQTDGEIHGTLSWWVTEVEEHSPLQAVTPSQVVWKTRWGSHGEQAMFPHGLCFICSCLKSLYRFSFMIDYKLQDEINTFL